MHLGSQREIPNDLYGTSSSLGTLILRPFLVPWSFTLGALVQVFVFFSTVQYAIIGTRVDFFNLEADGADHLLGQVCLFRQLVFFLGAFSLLYLTTDRSLYRSIYLSI